MRTYHFISGLPRSGSTLLSAILRQNPRFHAGMSSPVANFYRALLNSFSVGSEFASEVTTEQRQALLKGLFESYYADFDQEVLFDTNRGWTTRLGGVSEIFPDSKMICCVRNVAWIMDSMERQYQKNPFENTRLFNDDVERNTVYSRIDTLGQRNRMVGYAWSALKEAYYGPHSDRLLIVDYELLSTVPHKVMPLVYEFLGETPFEHNFEHVEYDAPAFDENLGLEGLHRISGPIRPNERQTILPPDLFANYADMAFWRDQTNTRAHVIAPKPTTAKEC